jgi:hypothetical protein
MSIGSHPDDSLNGHCFGYNEVAGLTVGRGVRVSLDQLKHCISSHDNMS